MTDVFSGAGIFAALFVASLIEAALPFRRTEEAPDGRRRANLILTGATVVLNLLFNAGIASLLIRIEKRGVGLFNILVAPPVAETLAIVVFLDFSFYASHVAMHKSPTLWRFHRIHHLDRMVDATTSFRQHPGEGLIRCGFTAAAAILIGASPAAFVLYRTMSAANAILEHANIMAPMPLARVMSWITSWPHYHKIHHSAASLEIDSNYGNLFSLWDRMFATHTQVERAAAVKYGLGAAQKRETALNLLAAPFSRQQRTASNEQ